MKTAVVKQENGNWVIVVNGTTISCVSLIAAVVYAQKQGWQVVIEE